MLFKACLITTILKELKSTFMSVNDPTDFISVFEVACKTYSSFESLLTNTFSLLDFFLNEAIIKPQNTRFAQFYVSSFRELREKFRTACQHIQEWDTSVPRLKYQLASFAPMLSKIKAYYGGLTRRLNLEDVVLRESDPRSLTPRQGNADMDNSILALDRIRLANTEVEAVRRYEYGDEKFSELLTREESVSPTVFARKIEADTVAMSFHRIIDREASGFRFLYILAKGVVVFATKISESGVPENNYLELELQDKTTTLQVRLRHESGREHVAQNRTVVIDNYEGNIELRKFRIDILEKVTVPLRTFYEASEEEQSLSQCDLEVSVLLSYVKKTSLEDFVENVSNQQNNMYIENIWGVKKRWVLPNYVEQNSLITKDQFESIKDSYGLANPNTEYCWSTFDHFIEKGYDLVPLCKSLIFSIFYADASIADKVSLLWDTLVFFEKLQDDYYFGENTVESDSIQYFTRAICEATWISMPEYAAENLVDYIFYGKIPSVRRAMYVSGEVVLLVMLENLRYNSTDEIVIEFDTFLYRPKRAEFH